MAINTWMVFLIRQSARTVEMTKKDLDEVDRKTHRLMTKHGLLHPKVNVSTIYFQTVKGGSIDKCGSHCQQCEEEPSVSCQYNLKQVIGNGCES